MSEQRTLFRFSRIGRPIAFDGCADLIESIAARLHGWDVAPWRAKVGEAPVPVITVSVRNGAFVLRSDTIDGEEVYGSTVNIVCAFMAELIMAYGTIDPALLLLHAGAVELAGHLIVYPAKGKTGKSTLTAQLARRGVRVFSDDVVPVNLRTGQGQSLGIEPRMRLPLPKEGLAHETRAWVETHMTLSGRHMGYVGLARRGPGSLAPLGEERPIGAFVQLVRVAGALPDLAPCPRTEIMQLLIGQNFGTGLPAPEMVICFKELVERTPSYRLRYGNCEAGDAVLGMPELAAPLEA